MSNSDGSTIEWAADYFPFGASQVTNSYLDNRYRFTGYEFDPETGYNYAGYRNESPALGRFFSPDPYGGSMDLTNPQSMNRYAYVLNDPVNLKDPFGLDGWKCTERSTSEGDTVEICTWSDGPGQPNGNGGGGGGGGGVGGGPEPSGGSGTGQGAPNNEKSICSSAKGRTIPVNAQFGQMRFQFNNQGNLVGFGLQLTGMNRFQGSGLSIPANTFVGATQLSPGTVQFGFSNPVNVGSGFSQAYFKTATFSGGRFTSVQGAYAPLGIALGSTSGNSSLLQTFLNGNSRTASQAQNFGNLLTSVASLVSNNVSCQDVFGGG